jgi:hypothetical protein
MKTLIILKSLMDDEEKLDLRMTNLESKFDINHIIICFLCYLKHKKFSKRVKDRKLRLQCEQTISYFGKELVEIYVYGKYLSQIKQLNKAG